MSLEQPPHGCAFHHSPAGIVATASARSVPSALFLLFFAGFWNSIVSVFVAVNTASTMNLLGISLPEAFPVPKMNGGEMGIGTTLFLWVFLTPFILIGLGAIAAFFNSVAGRCELKLAGDEGVIFTGIGPLGWRQRFRTGEVADVRLENRQWRDSDGDRRNGSKITIELSSGKKLTFGSSLPDARRKFLALATKRACRR